MSTSAEVRLSNEAGWLYLFKRLPVLLTRPTSVAFFFGVMPTVPLPLQPFPPHPTLPRVHRTARYVCGRVVRCSLAQATKTSVLDLEQTTTLMSGCLEEGSKGEVGVAGRSCGPWGKTGGKGGDAAMGGPSPSTRHTGNS